MEKSTEHMILDIQVYIVDRLVEVLKEKGHNPEVISACLPKWYHAYKALAGK